jgi:hypothetical protein
MAIGINIVNPLNAQLSEGGEQTALTRTPLAATALMAAGVTIWHIPFFVMPQFGFSPRWAWPRSLSHLVRLAV